MKRKKERMVTAVAAGAGGEIFELEGYAAVGMAGETATVLYENDTIPVPFGGETMLLPDRAPVVYNISGQKLETLTANPYRPGEPIYPAAVFNSPGYMVTQTAAYEETADADFLPLFSYAAAGWHRNGFVTAAVLVDSEKRQDLRLMRLEKVRSGVEKMRKKLPGNRLRAHLEHCALVYGCPAGKNFFLRRFEAPLPTSRHCNARCLGCISLQPEGRIPRSQNRIAFTPTAREIAEVALEHINHVRNAVVSFGQGCEGDPLAAAGVIEPAIRMIRSETSAGTINMNTNASLPDVLKKLFDAGLDSIRVSMNSVRKPCYEAYFQPKNYRFEHVLDSIRAAGERKKHTAVNYLNCPGFTDSPEEMAALMDFLDRYPVNMIQWRNLNFDPARYFKIMSGAARHGRPVGVKKLLREVRKAFPKIKFGYFNPPKEKF